MATDAARWRHGYELSQKTGLKTGTLYPLLIRLSDLAAASGSDGPNRSARGDHRGMNIA